MPGPNYPEALKRPYPGQPQPDPIALYAPSVWQRIACWLLEWAERLFLHAHGWERHSAYLLPYVPPYVPPDSYAFRRHPYYVRSHAVNAQKQLVYNLKHGGTRRDPDYP